MLKGCSKLIFIELIRYPTIGKAFRYGLEYARDYKVGTAKMRAPC